MKPYSYSCLENYDDRSKSYCFRTDVWKPGDPSTYTAVGSYQEMKSLADYLNTELVEREYKGKKFTRYITSWYVTIDSDEAARLCKIDGTSQMRITQGVELLHHASGFALWSDGKITKDVSHAPRFDGIAKCASKLISSLRGSDSGGAHLKGGFLRLSQIVEIGEESIVAQGSSRGIYNSPKVKKFDVRYSDGSVQTLYSTEEGYFEGYAYDIYENALEAIGHDVTGESGVDDFTNHKYDPRLGYVKDED